MLKGDVFAEQVFENQIFALFINTFLDGNNGVASNYKNGMPISASGTDITIGTGAVCIQGRFLEENTGTTLSVSDTNQYHSLVIEIDLDKTNTATNFTQAYFKILTSASGYPSLTQNNIVKNVSGVYQYELARFKTDGSGNISELADRRTYLSIDSIYNAIRTATNELLAELNSDADALINSLNDELQKARDESLFITNTVERKEYLSETDEISAHWNKAGRVVEFNVDFDGAPATYDVKIPITNANENTILPFDNYNEAYQKRLPAVTSSGYFTTVILNSITVEIINGVKKNVVFNFTTNQSLTRLHFVYLTKE